MFSCLQKSLDLSEMKLVPTSEIIFLGNMYAEKMILKHMIMLSADSFYAFLMKGNLLW